MEAIVLSFRGEPIRVFPLQGRPLEVGSGPGCDVVVHDAEVPARAWLVQEASDGVPVARPLAEGGPVRRLLPGVELAVGTRHSLSRAPELAPRGTRELSLVTEPIYVGLEPHEHLTLVLGRGRDARRFRLEGRPLTIGSQADCDVVILDRAVSGMHCRLEPGRQTAWVRDLGSRNGTWIDNVRTELGRVTAGSRIRLGRTEIYVVEEGRPGDAREEGLVAASWQMIEILGKVERLAKTMSPVLVWGPSGAGKEGLARALHTRGPRASQPFVALNAAAIPRDLVESELFGHEKGSFTGADRRVPGKVDAADGGTLFLDEVGELTLAVQARLLRFLQEHAFERVGGRATIKVDVRVLTATHRDLESLVAQGRFRQDLFYRLRVVEITVPPLRARGGDEVIALAEHFLDGFTRRYDRPGLRLSSASRLALRAHDWPGNVRELEHTIERAVVLCPDELIGTEHLGLPVRRGPGPEPTSAAPVEGVVLPLGLSLSEVEARYIEATLRACGNNRSQAARALGVGRNTLRRKALKA